LATTSVQDANDADSSEHDAVIARRFQHLARVRAHQRARRRNRVILAMSAVAALAGASVLGFATVRGTSSHPSGETPPRRAPLATPAPEATRPFPPQPAPAAPPASPLRAIAATPEVALPPRPPVDATPPRPAPPRMTGATVVPRAAPVEAETGDATAAIDWLFKTKSP
jgi:hypothetical protein